MHGTQHKFIGIALTEGTDIEELQEEISELDPELIQRIAVFRPGTLGDMILTTPLFAALKKVFPESHLTVIASRWNRIIPENHPDVDEVIGIPSGVGGIPVWLAILVGGRFDLYIDPKDHRSTTSRIIANWIRVPHKFVVPANLPLFASSEIIPPPADTHFVDSALAPMLVIAPDQQFERRPSFRIPEEARRRMEEALRAINSPFLLINVSTGSPTRRWPDEKWIALLREVDPDYPIVIIGLPEEKESIERIAATCSHAFFQPTENLMEVAALVDMARALITCDTSIVHIAGVLNKPLLALYFNAPEMMEKFAPLSDVQKIIVQPNQQPVAEIGVDEVVGKLVEFIELVEFME